MMKTNFNEGLAFEHRLLGDNDLNFVDHGPASMLDIDLAVNEVDPTMSSNLNFRCSDAFKLLITTSGLEELRVVLHYQMMHKQALIVATRMNQSVMDVHLRAKRELEIVKQNRAIPNMAICLSKLFTRTSDGIDSTNLSKIRSQFSTNLSNNVSQCMTSITSWKSISRTNLGQQYQQCLAKCEKQHKKNEVKLRVMRAFKVHLFNQYCNQVLEQVYASSTKYNVLAQCQRLRALNHYFQFRTPASGHGQARESNATKALQFSQLFDVETNDLIEKSFDTYSSERFYSEACKKLDINLKKMTKIEAFDSKKLQHLDVYAIPSSQGIVQMELPRHADKQGVKRTSLDEVQFDVKDQCVEGPALFRKILPQLSSLLDAPGSPSAGRPLIDLKEMATSRMYYYYFYLSKIVELELAVAKCGMTPAEAIEIDAALRSGLPYFSSHHEIFDSYEEADGHGEKLELSGKDATALGAVSNIDWGKGSNDIDQTETGKRLKESQLEAGSKNLLATRILLQMTHRRKFKADIGDDLAAIASKVRDLVGEASKHGQKSDDSSPSFHFEYLKLYAEIRYLQVVAVLQKRADSHLFKNEVAQGASLNNLILALAKRSHIQILSSNGIYHLNQAEVSADRVSLESSSLIHQFCSLAERLNFSRCVLPILSDRALEPQEITLLESVYLNNEVLLPDSFGNLPKSQLNQSEVPAQSCLARIRSGQYAGNCVLSQSSELEPLTTHLLCFNGRSRSSMGSLLKSMDQNLFEYLELIVEDKMKKNQSVLDFSQLKKSRRFLTD